MYDIGMYNKTVYDIGVYDIGVYNKTVYDIGVYNKTVYDIGGYNKTVYDIGVYNKMLYDISVYTKTCKMYGINMWYRVSNKTNTVFYITVHWSIHSGITCIIIWVMYTYTS